MNFSSDLSIVDRNTDIPYFPCSSWGLTQDDFGKTNLLTFNYIQAFYDTTLGVNPALCVWSGRYVNGTQTPILSKIQFAFSGHMIQFKGNGIFLSGVDIRGNAVSSIPIGGDPTSEFLEVIAYGGMA